jgi:ferredoxin
MMSEHLAVDRIRCDGRGLCADLIPEMIRLDDWGYPVIESAPVPRALRTHANRAVDSCPTLALRLEHREPSGR